MSCFVKEMVRGMAVGRGVTRRGRAYTGQSDQRGGGGGPVWLTGQIQRQGRPDRPANRQHQADPQIADPRILSWWTETDLRADSLHQSDAPLGLTWCS